MKTLSDGTEVASRTYYYLLDFNELDNWSFIRSEFGKHRLNELTIGEYCLLWQYAISKDLSFIQEKL